MGLRRHQHRKERQLMERGDWVRECVLCTEWKLDEVKENIIAYDSFCYSRYQTQWTSSVHSWLQLFPITVAWMPLTLTVGKNWLSWLDNGRVHPLVWLLFTRYRLFSDLMSQKTLSEFFNEYSQTSIVFVCYKENTVNYGIIASLMRRHTKLLYFIRLRISFEVENISLLRSISFSTDRVTLHKMFVWFHSVIQF